MIDLCELAHLPAPGAARLFRRSRRRLAAAATSARAARRSTTPRSMRRKRSRRWRAPASALAPAISPIFSSARRPRRSRRRGHDRLKTFGAGQERSRRAWIATVRQLFAAGALEEASAEHGGFRLTAHGEDILFGREPITLRAPPASGRRDRRDARAGRGGAARDGLDAVGGGALRAAAGSCATSLAKAEGIAAYMVFADRTLVEMAERAPADAAATARYPRGRRAQARTATAAIFLAGNRGFLNRRRRAAAIRGWRLAPEAGILGRFGRNSAGFNCACANPHL